MKIWNKTAYLFLALSLVLVWGCTQSKDGPMNATDSNTSGAGFYLGAELDSGRIVHSIHDTLLVRLDSLWIISRCYLQSIDEVGGVFAADSAYRMVFSLPLAYDPRSSCPTADLSLDTLIPVAPKSEWSAVNKFYLYGVADSLALLLDSSQGGVTLSEDDYRSEIKDSIWLMDGYNQDSLYSMTLDSLFNDPYQLPRKVGTSSPYVIRILRDSVVDTLFWKYRQQSCKIPRSSCNLTSDTIWPAELSASDTTAVMIRHRCVGDSTGVEYCASANWVDSLDVAGENSKLDTNWTWSTFFVESVPPCGIVNRDSLYAFSSVQVRYWRELFVPATPTSPCAVTEAKSGSFRESWIILDLENRALVLDSALADSVLHNPQSPID
jgi:hypothetical protein